MSKPTWGVVATVHETPQLLAAFAAHYLSAGANFVELYFDQPNEPARTLLKKLSNVKITLADKDFYDKPFWPDGRPDHIHHRQRRNASFTYTNATVDWLLHVDADEFLETDHLASELAEVPDDVDSLKLANSERVFLIDECGDSIFSGMARLPFDGGPSKARQLFGTETLNFTTKGFSGHFRGKSITRCGKNLRIGIHHPTRRGSPKIAPAKATICHFDGITSFQFVLKLMRYARSTIYDVSTSSAKNRFNQIEFARSCNFDLEELSKLHRYVSAVAPEKVEKLTFNGLLRPIEKNPKDSAYAYFTSTDLDLSIKAFNLALAATSDEASALYEKWDARALDDV